MNENSSRAETVVLKEKIANLEHKINELIEQHNKVVQSFHALEEWATEIEKRLNNLDRPLR